MSSPDICRQCHQEPTRLRCGCCGKRLCRSCAVSTGEGELCPECHSDMTHFLADVEVTHAPEVPHDGEIHIPRAG
ncbi:hypothetical protein [Deinococcus humi]|uniref:Zn finger protein HypA/HybF involved in hydrogenase expression n=1 Tax=Deinococcus humi TaxID=662880 RepID=A0A7W8JUI8_9DEIO|nr:hypothetical protein [Deinococcus humi]MBB5363068.1 Zn finger protein HypA/HybF involved in hydrogenase expression [Deinococcus humi]